VARYAWRLSALLGATLASAAAPAAVNLDLSYVDTGSPAYLRFKAWVDQALAGNPGYAFSATDAAYVFRIQGGAAYCNLAVSMVEEEVAAAEAAIAAAQRPEVAFDSYLYVGEKIRDLAITYDWCNASLTPAQRTRWAAYAEQAVWNVWNPSQAHWGATAWPWSGWSINDPGNNYHYSFLEATLYWALASNSTTWLGFVQNQKVPPLVSYFSALPGGGSREGTGYGLSHARLFEWYRLYRDALGTNLGQQSSHLDDSIDYWIHATVPTLDRIAPIGDQARVSYPDLYDYHRNLVLQARAISSNTAARARASWWLNAISVGQMESGFNFRRDLLPAGSGGTPPGALHHHATGTGHLFARSGWGSDAMWMSFVAGRFDQSHAHQDQGAFTLFARDFLTVTENIWTHSGIQQGTAVHNVLRFVNGSTTIAQVRDTTSTMSVTPGAGGVLDVAANLTPAYGGNAAIGAWTRNLHFADRSLRVTDQFAVGAGVQAVFQVNLPVAPVISGRNATAGALAIEVLEPANATLTALDWRTIDASEYLAGWKLEVHGSGNRFDVVLRDASAMFGDGFENAP
jgi:hypothetical protein